jgi:hypothetical protein
MVVSLLMQIWRRLKLRVVRMFAFSKAVVLRKKICAGDGKYTKGCENFVQVEYQGYLGRNRVLD